MTPDQLGGIVRLLIGAAGGYFISKGWVTAGDWAGVVVPFAALVATAAWSVWTNKPEKLAVK